MDIKVPASGRLTDKQKEEVTKGFNYMALQAEGGKARKRQGLPMFVAKADVPRLLRGVGRAPDPEELAQLMEMVPEKGIELQPFFEVLVQASETPNLSENELFESLRVLDLTRTGTLDPQNLKDILMTIGDRLNAADLDKVLEGVPRDGLGRVSCRLIARKLVKGPEDIPHL
mmetsp:Transcript_2227/g.4090  ORF Transcript_2227/g.4090 Transcript_2227/m.4090 type:complete len:172 (-) Transcript_2227:77-592(-)